MIDTGAILTFVVVSMTIGVVAFPINPPVFFIAHVKAKKYINKTKSLARWVINQCLDCSSCRLIVHLRCVSRHNDQHRLIRTKKLEKYEVLTFGDILLV